MSLPSWKMPRPSEMMTRSWEREEPEPPPRCCRNMAVARDSREITLVLFWSNLDKQGFGYGYGSELDPDLEKGRMRPDIKIKISLKSKLVESGAVKYDPYSVLS